MFNSAFLTYYFETNSFSIESLLTVVLLAIILIFLIEIIRILSKVSASLEKFNDQEETKTTKPQKK